MSAVTKLVFLQTNPKRMHFLVEEEEEVVVVVVVVAGGRG